MPNEEDDLRATADDIAADATKLGAIEKEKADLDAEDPRMQELSDEGERLAERMASKTKAESDLADAAQ